MSNKTYVYVSRWEKAPGEYGINGYEFNTENGEMRSIGTFEEKVAFGVTQYDGKRQVVYALEENGNLPGLRGGGGGRIFVFKVEPDSGKLVKIGCTETFCSSPCYMTLDKSGEYLLVSHHGGNSNVTKIGQDAHGNYYPIVEWDDVAVELFSLNGDGAVGKLLDVDKCFGSGPERRQTHAHPHSVVMSPDGKLFAVCDKGNDTVKMYKLDEKNGKLVRPQHIYSHKPGVLPRYCLFHPEKPWFYHNNESGAKLAAFSYDQDGLLQEIGTYDGAESNCEMKDKALEQQGLVIDSAGRYVYDIIRGPNHVAVFEVNQADGSLSLIQQQPVAGKWPRGCALSPDGRFLLVCCLGSGTVSEFKVGADGRLAENSAPYQIPNAVHATFCEI